MAYWESDPLLRALDEQGALVHVDTVPNGSACGCVCPSCKQPLIAKNAGSVLVHHFAHKKGACAWAVETSITLTVLDILREQDTLSIMGAIWYDYNDEECHTMPPDGEITLTKVSQVILQGRQAPLIAIEYQDSEGTKGSYYFVVVVNHPFTHKHLEALEDVETPLLALNFKEMYAGLRDEYGRHFSRGEFFYQIQDPAFLEPILTGKERTLALEWIHHPAAEQAEKESSEQYWKKWHEEREAERRKLEEEERQREAEREARRQEEERQRQQAIADEIERERQHFESQGVETLPIVRKGVHFFADGCPLYGQANITTDCGDFVRNENKCIFFEGKGYFLIGCTAHQNGVGLEDE